MPCQWCGDQHGVDQLCQRAQRGMTRRSFCFLFGAGIAGATLGGVSLDASSHSMIGKMTLNADGSINIYRTTAGGNVFRLVATVPNVSQNWIDAIPDFGESTPVTYTLSGHFNR